jgi:hypothetical protein
MTETTSVIEELLSSSKTNQSFFNSDFSAKVFGVKNRKYRKYSDGIVRMDEKCWNQLYRLRSVRFRGSRARRVCFICHVRMSDNERGTIVSCHGRNGPNIFFYTRNKFSKTQFSWTRVIVPFEDTIIPICEPPQWRIAASHPECW